MIPLLFFLMVAGYALGTVAAVLSPQGRAVRRGAATGAVVGGGAGLSLALAVFANGAPFALEAPALLSVADGLAFRLDALGALFLAVVGLVAIPSVHAYLTYLVLAVVGLLTLLLVWGA